jgi:hypothetical protein
MGAAYRVPTTNSARLAAVPATIRIESSRRLRRDRRHDHREEQIK